MWNDEPTGICQRLIYDSPGGAPVPCSPRSNHEDAKSTKLTHVAVRAPRPWRIWIMMDDSIQPKLTDLVLVHWSAIAR